MKLTIKNRFSMIQLFFIKSFFKYFVLLMIPVAATGPYVMDQFNKEVTQTAQSTNQNLLYQIGRQIDSLYQLTDNARFYLSRNPSVALSLKNAFRNQSLSQSDIKSTQNITVYLQNLVYTNAYLHSAYTYYENSNGRFLTSVSGLTDSGRYYDTAWLEQYRDSGRNMWTEQRSLKPYAFANEEEVLSVYRKLYSPSAGSESDGVLVMQFHLHQIHNYLNSLTLYPHQIIAFVDSQNGKLLVQNRDEDLTDILPDLMQIAGNAEYNSITITHNNEKYIASLTESQQTNGWRYLSLVPHRELYGRSIAIRQMILLLIGVVFLISILLSYLTARKEYYQLRSIFDLLNQPGQAQPHGPKAKKPGSRRDPYSYILNNIVQLFVEQDYLKIQVSEKKYHMQVLELRALQQQINPHFLFNTLNTLYWQSVRLTGGPNECSGMITDLSEIMQYSLSDFQEQVSLKEELEYLRHYIRIQNIRYEKKFSLIWDTDPQAEPFLIPKMTLQPLVENAIYHGIKEIPGNGIIKLKIYHRRTHITVHLLDTGTGIAPDHLRKLRRCLEAGEESASHIGLINTNRRLLLTYGQDSRIHLYSRPNAGTVLTFRIPAAPPAI